MWYHVLCKTAKVCWFLDDRSNFRIVFPPVTPHVGVQRKKHKKVNTLSMCTQLEILQNDLLRSAKLGPWQKKSSNWRCAFFSLFGIFCCFPLCSFFYSNRTNKGALYVSLIQDVIFRFFVFSSSVACWVCSITCRRTRLSRLPGSPIILLG